jgi:hypothetical protein
VHEAVAAGADLRRYRRAAVVGVAALATLGLGALGVRAWLVAPPRVVSVRDALEDYRSTSSTTLRPASAGPTPGVYVYASAGSESIDVLGGASHQYPSISTITVVSTACGSRLTWTPLEGRFDEYDLCVRSDGVAGEWTVNHHEFFHMQDEQVFTCRSPSWWLPPARVSAWSTVCRSGDRVLTRSARVVATETLGVGGVDRSAVHIYLVDVLGGASHGSTRADLWLDARTGLPLRWHSQNDSLNASPVGDVHFRETFDLTLRSVDPQR